MAEGTGLTGGTRETDHVHERAKELAALRAVAQVAVEDVSREELVAKVAEALLRAMQFPAEAVATVEIDGRHALAPETGNDTLADAIDAAIVVHGVVRGRVQVGYRSSKTFLAEEQDLLASVAQILSVWVARTEAVERLRESEAQNRLRAVALSAAANAVVITDATGAVEWVNEAFEIMSGYPAHRVIGSTPRLWSSGVHDDEVYRELWDTILAGDIWRGELVNRHADGHLYTVRQTITPVIGDSGAVTRFVAIQEDVTDRVTTQRELEAGRHRLQALFDTALDAIILADDHGRYLDVNPATEVLTGYRRDELLRMEPADLAAPEQPEDLRARFNGFRRSGTDAGAFSLRRKDGEIVDTEYRAVSDIQPGVHLSILRDVTDRNLMIKQLADHEARFRQLAENASDIVAQFRFDPALGAEVDYVNPAAVEILGYPLARINAEPDLLFRLFEDPSQLTDTFAEVPGTGDPPATLTVRLRRADGRPVWLEVNVTISDASTTPPTLQIIARDITTRHETLRALEQAYEDQVQAAENLRTLNAMKDTFLQSVSHELRTPLTSILGFAALLADAQPPLTSERAQAFHRRILANATQLQRLLDDLLDIDRLARGSTEPARTPTELDDLVRRTVAELDLANHPITLETEPVVLAVDAPWVERIVANLVRNAVLHTPPGTSIWVRLRAEAEGVRLTVDDDGPGIPEEDRDRLLEPFEQGSSAASGAVPGTGMGLATVDAFARMHGGRARISEGPEGGTRVEVTLAGG